jgi:hypothetical protein
MKVAVTFIILSIFSLQCFSQTYWIKKTPFFDFLYAIKKPISKFYFLGNSEKDFRPIPLNNKYQINNQILVKTKNDLYILVNGTGMVFKATDTTNDKIAFTRIDSTIYHGYNYGAFVFPYHDTIFSLGGYGIWRYNGALRFFHKSAEWNLLTINKEYPIVGHLFYFSENDNQLITVQDEYNDPIVAKDIKTDFPVIEWDLVQKKNKIIGYLKNSKVIQYSTINFPFLNGLITNDNNNTYLYDYEHNKIYKSKNEILSIELVTSSTYFNKAFAIDNKIYFTKDANDSLSSITVSMADFELTPNQIYTPINANMPYYLIFGSLVLFVPTLYFFISYKKKKIKPADNIFNTENEEKLIFTNLEKLIIESILTKSINNQFSTVEEINEIMGLSKKSNELKKRERTEIINSINQKFKIIFKKNNDLILRERSTLDKRYFQYIINAENIDFYLAKKEKNFS